MNVIRSERRSAFRFSLRLRIMLHQPQQSDMCIENTVSTDRKAPAGR